MLDRIIDFLTWCLLASEIIALIGGVLYFVFAISWMQICEEEEKENEQKAGAAQGVNPDAAAHRRRRRASSGDPAQMP